MSHLLRSAALATLVAASGHAGAQSAEPGAPGRTTPHSDPAMQAAPWRSALQGYQPFVDEKIAPWKASNETVGRIGGWKAYATEASQPGAASGTPEADRTESEAPGAAPAHPHRHGRP